jgi:hemerythrin-like domain-containing protein
MAEEKTTHFYKYIHVALRQEVAAVLVDATAVVDAAGAEKLVTRVARLASMAHLHAAGEEMAIFPLLAGVLPGTDRTFLFDHKEEHTLLEDLEKLARRVAAGEPEPALKEELRRQAVVVDHHFSLHMRKENQFVLPTLNQTESTKAQEWSALVNMLSVYQPRDVEVLVPWIVSWLKPEDRELCVRELIVVMRSVFDEAKAGIKATMPAETWNDLAQRVPELA